MRTCPHPGMVNWQIKRVAERFGQLLILRLRRVGRAPSREAEAKVFGRPREWPWESQEWCGRKGKVTGQTWKRWVLSGNRENFAVTRPRKNLANLPRGSWCIFSNFRHLGHNHSDDFYFRRHRFATLNRNNTVHGASAEWAGMCLGIVSGVYLHGVWLEKYAKWLAFALVEWTDYGIGQSEVPGCHCRETLHPPLHLWQSETEKVMCIHRPMWTVWVLQEAPDARLPPLSRGC